MYKPSTLLSLLLPLLASATPRTAAPAGALVVGPSAQYKTLSSAIAALGSSSSAQSIFIQPGTYAETVYIPNTVKGALTIQGYTEDDQDFAKNQVKITHSASLSQAGSDDKTGTLRAWNDNFKLYNVDIANSYGKGEQAIALSAYGNQQGYYGVRLFGYQDTLLSNQGKQVYSKCYIEGAVDFIFGQKAITYITHSQINTIGPGAVTASGRNDSSNPSYYILNNSTITGTGTGTNYLGRPWGSYARVIVQDTELSAAINSKGWEPWNAGQPRTDHVDFEEFGNTGVGSQGSRAFARRASSAVSLEAVMGDVSWVDETFVS
ncbi:MAG: hypothetical protein Q9162_003318 [Coniocarpon cinnabarinum]